MSIHGNMARCYGERAPYDPVIVAPPSDSVPARTLEVSPLELARMRAEGSTVLLLDCRTHAEREIARIEPSMHVPLGELAARLRDLREHEDACIIVHCHHGVRSLQVTLALRAEGFADVRSLAGGIEAWSMGVDPTVPRY